MFFEKKCVLRTIFQIGFYSKCARNNISKKLNQIINVTVVKGKHDYTKFNIVHQYS